MLNKMKLAGAFAVALILSGCVIDSPRFAGTPRSAGPTFAEGNWSQGDVASYVFGNGSFVGSAQDTGNRLSDGTYRYTGPNQISISGTSTLRGTSFQANCLAASPSQLNCTSDSGAQFSLFRSRGLS